MKCHPDFKNEQRQYTHPKLSHTHQKKKATDVKFIGQIELYTANKAITFTQAN